MWDACAAQQSRIRTTPSWSDVPAPFTKSRLPAALSQRIYSIHHDTFTSLSFTSQSHSEMADVKFEYQLVYKRGARPRMEGEDLHVELETTGVPPGAVRYQFTTTRFRGSKSSYRDVLLESILRMCETHRVTPLEIRHPSPQGGQHFVDVILARESDVLKVYEDSISFDFYGTQPEIVQRGVPDRKHVTLCIQMLPFNTNLDDVVRALMANPRIRKAGQVVDVWSVHAPDTHKFNGKLLVLLELHTQNGVASLTARSAVPGWFVFQNVACLVRFPDRPAWCLECRYDETSPFHSMHTCPLTPCITCKKRSHTAVQCPKRQAQVTKKSSNLSNANSPSHNHQPRAAPVGARASLQQRLAPSGFRGGSQEADDLTRDFGVLALSEDGSSN